MNPNLEDLSGDPIEDLEDDHLEDTPWDFLLEYNPFEDITGDPSIEVEVQEPLGH